MVNNVPDRKHQQEAGVPTTGGGLPQRRRAGFPLDGTIVTAMTIVGPDSLEDGVQPEMVTGRLETRWVDVFESLQVVVAGNVVDIDTVALARQDHETANAAAGLTLEIIDSRTVRDQNG